MGFHPFKRLQLVLHHGLEQGILPGSPLRLASEGPGAIFWMWVIAIIGMATAFIESTLAQVYKVKDGDTFRGGPAYYMQSALGNRKLGIIFAVLLTLCFGFIFNAVQSNTISSSFNSVFHIEKSVIGLVLIFITALVIFGGVKRIAHVTQIFVPIMAILYIAVAFYVVIMNISEVPAVFKLIFTSAFGMNEAVGGAVGAAIMQGVRRDYSPTRRGWGVCQTLQQ